MEKFAKSINNALKESSTYKHYLNCKKNVESNRALKKIKSKMEELKKKNCKSRDADLINEYYALERKYMESILVKEYESSKREMYCLLSEIGDILSLK